MITAVVSFEGAGGAIYLWLWQSAARLGRAHGVNYPALSGWEPWKRSGSYNCSGC